MMIDRKLIMECEAAFYWSTTVN